MSASPKATTGPKSRPTVVTVLGWVLVALSAFAVLSASFALVMMRFMTALTPEGQFPPGPEDFGTDLPGGFDVLWWMNEHFLLLAVVQLAMAAFGVFAAIMFLKLRPWARTYFEVMSWLTLAWTLLFGVFFAVTWVGMMGTVVEGGAQSGQPPAALLGAIGVFVATFVTLFNGAIPAALIWLLRSRHVRPAFSGGG